MVHSSIPWFVAYLTNAHAETLLSRFIASILVIFHTVRAYVHIIMKDSNGTVDKNTSHEVPDNIVTI